MLYPNTIEEKTGFLEIRKLIGQACISTVGLELTNSMSLSSDAELIRLRLSQTGEMMSIIQLGLSFPDKHYFDARIYTSKLKAEGSYLIEEEWLKMRQMLESAGQLLRFFSEKKENYPQLYILLEKLPFDAKYISEIDRCVDDKGQIKPSASKELYEIIHQIISEENRVRKTINSLAKKVIENGWGPENTVTIRNDRMVLAIFSEHKRKVNGLVHDESATGQTFFIEPTEIFELNNAIRELYIDRQREIRKLLIDLTNRLRPSFPLFDQIAVKMGVIDFIRAKAILSGKLKASIPQIDDKPGMNWMNARHPLLLLHHKKNNRAVIPFDLILNRDKRIMVVSGPNAGGKSVLLKAVGLLQLMIQHGIPVPASPDSKVGIYKQIFVDIGDQQSIDNDLSTYSSHLTNMKHFVSFATSKTLFLIDEMGTGTDPLYGGPMAEAVLEQLNRKFSFGVITTHFSNLKLYASHTHGLANGSMVFDNEALQPLYRFDDGKPGSSYTFEIAAKTGIDKDIITQAKKKTGNKLHQADKLLIELEREKTYIKNLKEDLETQKKKSETLKTDYEALKNELELKKNSLLKEYKSEALKVLTDAKRTVENTIREIKETQASQHKISRQPLEKMLTDIESSIEKEETPIKKNIYKPSLKVGDWVKTTEDLKEAEVLSISKDKVELIFGDIIKKYPLSQVEKIVKPKSTTTKKSAANIDLNMRMAHFNTEINIIGMRGEEAMAEVMQFIDEAIMLGHDRIRIVHGRGSGILKNLVRNELKRIRSVKNFSDESPEFGGDAITIVQLA